MKKRILLGILTAGMLVLTAGCSIWANGKLENEDVKIKRDSAKELALVLNIGAGELSVERGAKNWLDGTIEFNHEKLRPIVTYDLKNHKGTGVIKQKSIKNVNVGKLKNNWKLNLSDEIPLDLRVNSGAAISKLDLTGLKLNSLDVNAGVGDLTINLGGKREKSFDATIKLGVGKSTIILPKDVGVKIDSTKGIGKAEFVDFISKGNGIYVNQAYDKADVIINLKTELGVGEAIFKLE